MYVDDEILGLLVRFKQPFKLLRGLDRRFWVLRGERGGVCV